MQCLKNDVYSYSFDYFTLILSLHYLLKCKSRNLAVYNNKFILGNAWLFSDPFYSQMPVKLHIRNT